MRRLVTFLMVVASVEFACILLQAHYGVAEKLQAWRSESTPSKPGDDQGFQLHIDIAGKKGTISVRTHPSVAQDQKALTGNNKLTARKKRPGKGQPKTSPESGTKSQ
jgi:hypothetical protein